VSELLIVGAFAAAILVVGIVLGMLVAPRLTRAVERGEEESRDDEPG
jgi:hypothetical protein